MRSCHELVLTNRMASFSFVAHAYQILVLFYVVSALEKNSSLAQFAIENSPVMLELFRVTRCAFAQTLQNGHFRAHFQLCLIELGFGNYINLTYIYYLAVFC